MFGKDKGGRKLAHYVLNWNDEYLDMQIVAGPCSLEEAKGAMREAVTGRLVELDLVDNVDTAGKMYDESADYDLEELHISDLGASVMYRGNYYEDRYQIVEYDSGSPEEAVKV